MKIKINKELKINEKFSKIKYIQFQISKINKVTFFVFNIFIFLIQGYNELSININAPGECFIHIENITSFRTSFTENVSPCSSNENYLKYDFSNKGTFNIIFTDSINSFKNMFKDCNSLTNINFSDDFANKRINDMSYMFANCSSLTKLDLTKLNFSNVKNMSHMFEFCTKLDEISFPINLDTSQLENMEYMYSSCFNLKDVNMSNFNTASVKNMNSLFKNCKSLTSVHISNFDTKSLINMGSMFQSCTSLGKIDLPNYATNSVKFMNDLFHDCIQINDIDLSKFSVENVVKMESMFENCKNLASIDLSTFKTSSLRHMYSIFSGCTRLTSINISQFDTFQITNFANVFYNCHSLESIELGNFVTNMARDMSYMFFNCSTLTFLNLSNFNTERVLKMNSMFQGCTKLSQLIISNFENNEVMDMNHMFDGCANLSSLDLSNFYTNEVKNMHSLFARCSKLESLDLETFDTKNVLNMKALFYGCSSLTSLILDSFNTSIVENMGFMFYDCFSLTTLIFGNFSTEKVETFDSMFYNCRSLKSLSVISFDTSKANSMSSMFHGCSLLETIELNHFDTKKVLHMEGLFYGCRSLIKLNISNFNVIKVISLSHMFYECSSLTSINLPNLRYLHAISTTYMFAGCSSLTSLNLTKFDGYCVENMDYMFSGCSYLTNLIVDRWDTRNVKTMNYMFSGCISLTSLNITTFQTNSLRSIKGMFYGCESLESMDLSRLDTHLVTTMEYMFYKAISLKSINVNDSLNTSSYFKTENVENMRYMFAYCTKLKFIDLSFLYTPNLTDMSFMFLECESLTSANLSNFDTSKVTTIEKIFFKCSNLVYINLISSDFSNINNNKDILNGTLPNMVFCINKNNLNWLKEIKNEKNDCLSIEDISPCDNRKILIMKNDLEYDNPPICINNTNWIIENKCYLYDYRCYPKCPEGTEPENEDSITCVPKDKKTPKCSIQKFIIGMTEQKNCTNLTELFQRGYNETSQGRMQLITDLEKEFNDTENYIYKHVLDKGMVYNNFYNETYQVTNLSDKNLYDNLTYINIQDCENRLRLNKSIDPKEELMLLKIEYSSYFKIPIIEYVFFNRNMSSLDISACYCITFIYSIPVNTNDLNFINESTIYKYNPDSEYNNDLCFQFTTEYNTDITLFDRRKEFNDNNLSLCESNCKFIEYENNRVKCECPVKNKNEFNQFLNKSETEKMNSIFRFHNNKEQSTNLAILKCFKMLFSKFGFSDNYPSIIYIVILIANLAAALFFCISDYKNLYSQIQSYTESLDKTKDKRKDKKGRQNMVTTGNNNPPPKLKGEKIFKKQKNDLISDDTDKNSDNTGKFDSKIIAPTSLIDSKNLMKGETDRGLRMHNKEDYFSEITEMEINMLSYLEAQKSDKRGFVEFYFSFLKTRELLIYIFTNDYNSFIVKTCFLCFAFGISVGINTFFYNDSVIHFYYEKKGDATYSESVAKHLGSIFISILIASIIKSIMLLITLTDVDVIDIKDTTHMSREEKTNRALVKVTSKSTLFFVINFIVMAFFWIYVGTFGIVFKNTQIFLLIDGIVTFCGVLGLPLLYCLVPAGLRMVALNGKNNEYLYKFSQFLELI